MPASGEAIQSQTTTNGQDNTGSIKGQAENRTSRDKNRTPRPAQSPKQTNKTNPAEGSNRNELAPQGKREGNEHPPRQGRNNRNNNRRNNGNKQTNPNEQNEAKKVVDNKKQPAADSQA